MIKEISMKKIIRLAVVLILAGLIGCASLKYSDESATEIHPGHVGHEIH